MVEATRQANSANGMQGFRTLAWCLIFAGAGGTLVSLFGLWRVSGRASNTNLRQLPPPTTSMELPRVHEESPGADRKTLDGVFPQGIHGVAVTSDGRRVITAGGLAETNANHWDAVSGEFIHAPTVHSAAVTSVAINAADGRILTAAVDGSARMWGGPDYEMILNVSIDSPVRGAAFHPTDQRFALATDAGIQVWKFGPSKNTRGVQRPGALDAEKIAATFRESRSPTRSVAFSPDGFHLLGGSDDGVRLWDAESGELLLHLKGSHGDVACVAYHPDGPRFASASKDGSVKVWDAVTGEGLLNFRGEGAPVHCVAFSPNGRWLASGRGNGAAVVWDVVTGEERFHLASRRPREGQGFNFPVRCIAFTPDSSRVVAGDTVISLGNPTEELEITGRVTAWDLPRPARDGPTPVLQPVAFKK
ncbi:MAG: WD40 repeat domain-containing protein [Planctomycetales bacterium]